MRLEFETSEHKKQLKNRIRSTKTEENAKRRGMSVSCKEDRAEIVVCRRGKSPQYAFSGAIAEGEGGCKISGEIELVGKPWRWYHYLLTVLSCLVFFPLTLLLLAGDLIFVAYFASGNPMKVGVFPFPFTSEKSREKKLTKFMSETLGMKRTV